MDNENHPSFNHRCTHQYSVKARPYGMSSNGWGCGLTGGHCLPSNKCQKMIEDKEKEEEEEAMKLKYPHLEELKRWLSEDQF